MAKAAEKLYLTFKKQWEWSRDDQAKPINERTEIVNLPLGFANAYEPHKKDWDKKKLTQLHWAYNLSYQSNSWEERDDGIWIKERRGWTYPTYGEPYLDDLPAYRVEEYLQPKIIDNTPMSGFKIAHSVSRYSTSNKLWRIEDPRGFELEITTGNMEAILMNQGVLRGEIQGTYHWVGKFLAVYEG